MTFNQFEEIEGWQMARLVCQEIFKTTTETELGRDFSLKDQMLRSSGSIMDNIAEGFDAGSNREFVRFLQYSKRSCSELQSQLYRCLDRRYVAEARFDELYVQVGSNRSKIGGFIRYLTRNMDARTIADSFSSTGNSELRT